MNAPVKRLLRTSEVAKRVGMSRQTIKTFVDKGEFPKPLPISYNRYMYLESEIDAWIDNRIKDRDAEAV